ncbi:MAG: trypsin-like peptidase domain-containing protein, partial [Nocardioidaceae bacterium]
MTEKDPRPEDRHDTGENAPTDTEGNADTERLAPESHHRYASPAPSSGWGERPASPDPAPGYYGPPAPAKSRTSRPGTGVIAAIIVAALVVGGLAGVAGAAGFTVMDGLVGDGGSASSSSSTGVVTSNVTQDKAPAAAKGSVQQVADAVLPSVVKINVTGPREAGSGSGIILSSNGRILTNNHVVAIAAGGGSISVNFNDGTAKPAKVIGTDPVTDLAVIKADGVSGLQPATIDTSQDLAVGQHVVAIGSPFGLEATVTSGIVSALHRPVSVKESQGSPGQLAQLQGTATTYPAIQTDAAINPGNSGGPLVNMNGEVIGINSSIRTSSSGGAFGGGQGGSIGLGFAIPVSNVWPVVQQLVHGVTPTHARLGVTVADASSKNGLLSGAGIRSVNAGSAAQKAGLKRGDVITKVDNQLITGAESLVATIRGHRPGDTVKLTVYS